MSEVAIDSQELEILRLKARIADAAEDIENLRADQVLLNLKVQRVQRLHSDAEVEAQQLREKIAEQRNIDRGWCVECGSELISSSTGCADEPDECLVCHLRAKVLEEEDRASQYMEQVDALIRALKHIGLEPGGQCVDITTNFGAISLGLHSDGKTFDVKWSK